MAMDLIAAQAEIEDAIKTGMQAKYPTGTDGSATVPDDFADIAEGIAPGIVAALQHILDNAETSSDPTPAEGENHAHGGIL